MRRLRRAVAGLLADERGASPVEFVLVGTLLTAVTLGVLQFGLAIYVRNVVHDAAVEGAFHAALADTALQDGVVRTRDVVSRTVGDEYAQDVEVRQATFAGRPVVEISVRTPLPLLGLFGPSRMLEVTAHAPLESLD